MTNLIGDNKKRTINPEAWKEHNRMYGKEEKPTEPAMNPPSVNQENNLEKILTYDTKGKPVLELEIKEKTTVRTLTQAEYDTLMQIYESGGWLACTNKLPTIENIWYLEKSRTCMDAKPSFEFNDYRWYEAKHYNILSLQEFCDIQKINSNQVKELNDWYDKNRPNRPSKKSQWQN